MRTSAHPWDKGKVLARQIKLFVQRSSDQGGTWSRQEWVVPGFDDLIAFSRPAHLADDTVLVPVYGVDTGGTPRNYVWRVSDGGRTARLLPTGAQSAGIRADETAFVEVSPGRVLAMSRNAAGYFSEMWSDDGGRTWTYPLLTDIWAPHSPPHLLKLEDGRILCSFGYRRVPMGIRAVLSSDAGQTWDTDNIVVLRDDGGTPTQLDVAKEVDLEGLRLSGDAFRTMVRDTVARTKYPSQRARADVGYAISTQLSDDSILTAYYITLADGITHSAATRWKA